MHVRKVVSAAVLLGLVATLFAAVPGDPPTPARGRGAGAGRGRGGAPAAQAQTPNAADVARVEVALPEKAPAAPAKPRKVLAFGKATAFVHATIPLGVKTIELLGTKTH